MCIKWSSGTNVIEREERTYALLEETGYNWANSVLRCLTRGRLILQMTPG
jgi:hypothetical protein